MARTKNHTMVDNKQRWNLAMNMTNMGFYDWYPLEDRIIWDKTLHRITGLSTRSKKKRQEYFISVVHPEDVELVVKDMGKVLDPTSTNDSFENNLRVILKGQIRYMRTSGFREIDKSGRVWRVFGIVMDTTSMIESEIRIRENEERLRTAAEATGFGTFDWLVQENNLYWDKKMHEIFGLNEKSKVDRNEYFFNHIHPEDQQRVGETFASRLGTNSTDHTAFDEFKISIKGKVKNITSHGNIIRDSNGNAIRITGTLLDITHLKKTEKDLRESQEYFRSVFEGNSDHIFTINHKREIVFINHAAPGLTRDQVIGTPILNLVVPQDRKMVGKVLDKVFNKRVTEQYETSYESPESTLHYSTKVSPLIENNRVFGATFVSRDVTKLMESDGQLRKQAIELQRTNQNLEQFAYVSSHDIKAPVTNLESLLGIMEEQNVVKTEGKPIFDRLKITVGQMNRTIRTLNEVFSVQSNLNLPKKKVYLDKILAEVSDSINNQILDSGAKITSDFSHAPYVKFPEIHLKSILQNLITNSIKYRQDGITPKIRIRSRQIKSTKKIQLTVADNGRGMDLDMYSKKVFGLFQRFHLDTEGKGMGLYIIKLIIESYGGQISLKSEPNKGSKFTLVF